MSRRNLVLARVGPKSLHRHWLGSGGRSRTWDLALVPYTDVGPQPGCVVTDVVPGPKWTGLRHVLNTWDDWREYEQIWMPDDDILTDVDTIDRMFQIARDVGLDLFAPALDTSSYYAHFTTMQNARFHGRWTGFVEIMVPGFSRSALERLLPTLDLTETGWGWGLDSLWPKLLEYRDVGVIDATPVVHTRPVGQMRDPELALRVRVESDEIMRDHECRQEHTTYGAFGADLEPLELTQEELFAELVRGWRYLIDADPRVLTWLAAYQEPAQGWPDYPIDGTPTVEPATAA